MRERDVKGRGRERGVLRGGCERKGGERGGERRETCTIRS